MCRVTHHDEKPSVSLGSTRLQKKIFSTVLASREFLHELGVVAASIRKAATTRSTEKTIEGCFERELYALLKTTGIKFSPEKEVTVETRRHIGKGRVDSRIGAIVIEYKRPAAFKTPRQIEKATQQIEEYVEGVSRESNFHAVGFLTDGKSIKCIKGIRGTIISRSTIEPLKGDALLQIVRNLICLDLDQLSPQTLISDFCGTECSGPIYQAARVFYHLLKKNSSRKTAMLRSEWEEIFKLGHNDLSQQRRIEERRVALAEIFCTEMQNSEDEYGALFALHTAYAVVIKLIAYKVVTEIWFRDTGLKEYESLVASDVKALRGFCAQLEEGGIFRSLGILNLLEGDFFSWYTDKSQWSTQIASSVEKFLRILVRYVGTADVVSSSGAVDLFRDLYEATVPQVIRATFGEFYTPYWLAQHVLNSARPGQRARVLDPCCGSGTFLIAAIERIRDQNQGESKDQILDLILRNVVGIDLNPLAVLTARVNYFIHISDLLQRDMKELVIPVYLGDACHPPAFEKVNTVSCLSYSLKTLKRPIEVTLPVSAVRETARFITTMLEYEQAIRSQKRGSAYGLISGLVPKLERDAEVLRRIKLFTEELIDLEAKGWNGIWARIITNFFATAAIGSFHAVVGNPPWVDWKNLPSGYRERIKGLCIDSGLFSGDRRTGGINLNICALISFASAQNWLSSDGRLAFLMPKELAMQQSYQGWRRLMGQGPLFFQEFHDWSHSGHPFDPSKEDFMTYVFSTHRQRHKKHPVFIHRKKKNVRTKASAWRSLFEANKSLTVTEVVTAQVIPKSTALTFAESEQRLKDFSLVAGECHYIGREGIEFYPQELQLFYYESHGPKPDTVIVRNIQTRKSKYKIGSKRILLETKYLFPLVKGPFIQQFAYKWDGVMVAFPYDSEAPHRPLKPDVLERESPHLLEYYLQNRELLEAQTGYSDKLRGPNAGEFYGVARTGPYSFAPVHVAFRDNTRWRACVVKETPMPWGETKRFVFQNHAVSISERAADGFITEEEAHYICAILNAPVIEDFIYASSDQRSYKIRPPVFIQLYDCNRRDHRELAELSKTAHLHASKHQSIRQRIEAIYMKMCECDRTSK